MISSVIDDRATLASFVLLLIKYNMRVYISGPMSGLENNNFDAFFSAESKLKEKGHIPLNPARSPHDLLYAHYMDIAMAMVRSSQAIFLLPGWENSPGARAEYAYAQSIGLQVIANNE